MSDASDFLTTWVPEHLNPIEYDDENTAKHLAETCLSDANDEGLSKAEVIDAAGGDLVAFMLSELNGALDEMIKDKVAREGEREGR
jgi:hypothetical protein